MLVLWYYVDMSNDLNEIKEKINANKDYLRATYGVEEIGIFGSFARGDNTENSDIDIAVELNDEKVQIGLFGFARMKFFLEDLFGRKVDLVTKNSIKPIIKDRILNQLIIV